MHWTKSAVLKLASILTLVGLAFLILQSKIEQPAISNKDQLIGKIKFVEETPTHFSLIIETKSGEKAAIFPKPSTITPQKGQFVIIKPVKDRANIATVLK